MLGSGEEFSRPLSAYIAVKIERALREGPLFHLLRRLTSGPGYDPFVRDTHRESGVFSIVALLSPVDSSISSGALLAHEILVRRGDAGSKEKAKKSEKRRISTLLSELPCGFSKLFNK